MNAFAPYRASPSSRARFAPPIGWTHVAARAVLMLGAVPPACGVYALIADPGCPRSLSFHAPHIVEALLLLTATVALGLSGWACHRGAVRWVQRHVRLRSRVAGLGAAVATLLPVVAAGLVGAFAATWFYFTFAWHLCLDGIGPLFSFGC